MKLRIILSVLTTASIAAAPRMTIVIVIDQLSAHYLPKLKPYLTGGLGFLYREGTNYTNAFYDHCPPCTAAGHAMLATGTYGSVHGIICNRWFNEKGEVIESDSDTAQNAAMFSPTGLYPFGKSARNMLVDTLSDQFMLHSYTHAKNTVWSISHKGRSAIAMAGRLGKALWLDTKTQSFTSSKAYFDKLPHWVGCFNRKHQTKEYTWKTVYKDTSAAYDFPWADNSTYSGFPSPLNRLIKLTPETYLGTPLANKQLLQLAQACIEQNLKKDERFILWLGLSSLDMVAHVYGPAAKTTLDIIYHIDRQLQTFIDYVYSKVDKKEVLFVLTADHGIAPIPELLQTEGLDLARRYLQKDLQKKLNDLIERKYAITGLIQNYSEPQFYLNKDLLNRLGCSQKKKIFKDIKEYLMSIPGIRKAWTFDELLHAQIPSYDLDSTIQHQLFKGRSGDILYSVYPYTMINIHSKGTSHITQYAYDTHVPLIFYQADRFTAKRISKTVSIRQVPVTLATLFDVPRPSAATGKVLQGLMI